MARNNLARSENILAAAFIIVLTVFAMATADAIVKYASADLPLWQIFVVRSLVVITGLSAAVLFVPRSEAVWAAATGWSFVRGLLLTLMYIAIYAAIPMLSLATVAAALYAAPLFIALLSALLMKESVGAKIWAAVAVGFLGVMLIIRPGTDAFSPLALVPVAAAILYALAALIARTKCAGESPVLMALALNFSLLAAGLAATLVMAVWQPVPAIVELYPFLLSNWVTMGLREWAIVTVLGVLMIAISVGLAKAYQLAAPAAVAAFDYSYLLFSIFWGFVLFNEVPDVLTIGGVVLVAGAGLLVIAEERQSRVCGMSVRNNQ